MADSGWLPSITERLDDSSDVEQFQFTFYCDRCGVKYRTAPIPFSVRFAPTILEDFTAAQRMIWDSEHEDAYERANRESMLAFTRCADCERMVCEDCMNNLEQNICVDCENRRNGEGG